MTTSLDRPRRARPTGDGFETTLANAKQGDAAAFEVLFRVMNQRVHAFVRVRGATDPEGMVNEVFLKVFKGLARFEGNEAQFAAWVFRIARNTLIDEGRRAQRRPDESSLEGAPQSVEAAAGDVELEALARLGDGWVAERLATLTPEQREVVLLRIVGDQTIESIADITGRKVGAVKALQRRAFRTLARTSSQDARTPLAGSLVVGGVMSNGMSDADALDAAIEAAIAGHAPAGPLAHVVAALQAEVAVTPVVPMAPALVRLVDSFAAQASAAVAGSTSAAAPAATFTTAAGSTSAAAPAAPFMTAAGSTSAAGSTAGSTAAVTSAAGGIAVAGGVTASAGVAGTVAAGGLASLTAKVAVAVSVSVAALGGAHAAGVVEVPFVASFTDPEPIIELVPVDPVVDELLPAPVFVPTVDDVIAPALPGVPGIVPGELELPASPVELLEDPPLDVPLPSVVADVGGAAGLDVDVDAGVGSVDDLVPVPELPTVPEPALVPAPGRLAPLPTPQVDPLEDLDLDDQLDEQLDDQLDDTDILDLVPVPEPAPVLELDEPGGLLGLGSG